MVTLNSDGEIADFVNESQFEGGESAYECVAFSAALIKYSGAPGHGPTGTGEQVDTLADQWYGKEEGDFSASNTNGMSLDAEYTMLAGMGLQHQPLSPDVSAIKAAVQGGLPVMLCGAETGMYDVGLGDIVPYAWTPSGNHCIVVSGIASDGNFLVRDTASIAPMGVRPGPRTYDVSKLQIVSATAVTPPWKGGSMVPNGWKDDGTTLTAPNGVEVVLGFRGYVLNNNWDAGNVPLTKQYYTQVLEASNPALGDGDQIIFLYGDMLGYPHNPQAPYGSLKETVIREWTGKELLYAREHQGTGLDPVAVKNRLAAISLAAQQAVTLAAQPIT